MAQLQDAASRVAAVSGTVHYLLALGTEVGSGTAVLRVDGTGRVWIRGYVSPGEARQLHTGAVAQIHGDGWKGPARISAIGEDARHDGLVAVLLQPSRAGLLPGEWLHVALPGASGHAWRLPASALVMSGTRSQVFTVVTKLFLQCDADRAYFGEKDYQQLQVVIRLAEDLDLKTKIAGCPTVREDDGLAMSSRNLRLAAGPRETAPVIAQVLNDAARALSQGGQVAQTLDKARAALLSAGFDTIDYLELRSDPDLKPMTRADRPGRLFLAVWLDGVRLIDNVPVAGVRNPENHPLEPA